MIKKATYTIFTLISGFFLLASNVGAQDTNYKIPNPGKYDTLEEVISAAASLIRPIFLLTFGAMLLFGAYLVLTSRGDADKIAGGRKTIVAAIIGFVIAVLAPTLANVVIEMLGVEGLSF